MRKSFRCASTFLSEIILNLLRKYHVTKILINFIWTTHIIKPRHPRGILALASCQKKCGQFLRDSVRTEYSLTKLDLTNILDSTLWALYILCYICFELFKLTPVLL